MSVTGLRSAQGAYRVLRMRILGEIPDHPLNFFSRIPSKMTASVPIRFLAITCCLQLTLIHPCLGREPLVGACTVRFFQSMKPRMTDEGRELKSLAARARAENSLELDETDLHLYSPSFQPDLNFIKDPQERARLGQLTAMGLAHRASLLQSRLSPQEWKTLTTLWADYLDSAAQVLKNWEADDFCGPGREIISVAKDTGFMALLFIFVAGGGGAGGAASPGGAEIVISPFAFATDVLTFVPGTLMKWTPGYHRWRKNAHIKKSAKAFHNFAQAVINDEQKYP
jgi:hypothetical protein